MNGKTAIVTGASRGIGRAIVEELAGRGANVVFTYHSGRTRAAALLKSLGPRRERVAALKADVRDFRKAMRVVAYARKRFGGVDILVNNAGLMRDAPFLLMTRKTWRQVLDTDLDGVFNYTKAAFHELCRRGSGRIVNVSSNSALRGVPGQANYAAAKGGVNALTRTLATEAARFGVTVNAVLPGCVETEMFLSIPKPARERWLDSIPLGRFGKPGEIAKMVAFLASDEAAYITGQAFAVDGGLTA